MISNLIQGNLKQSLSERECLTEVQFQLLATEHTTSSSEQSYWPTLMVKKKTLDSDTSLEQKTMLSLSVDIASDDSAWSEGLSFEGKI